MHSVLAVLLGSAKSKMAMTFHLGTYMPSDLVSHLNTLQFGNTCNFESCSATSHAELS